MRSFLLLCATYAALGSPTSAAAQVRGQGWSVVTGRTVGMNDNILHVQAGWPGVSATLLHGMSPKVDLGGIVTFNYGFEGDVNVQTRPGLKFQGLIRANFADSHKFNVGINFAPGPLFYFFPSTTVAGIAIPVGLAFGIRATSDMNVGLALEMPMFVLFSSSVRNGQLVLPLLGGGGIEYFIGRNLALTFSLRLGPMIYTSDGVADFDFQGLMGLAFKL
jgi:hypothetical protein